MRRAIVDMEWRAQQWINKAHARPKFSPDLNQGLIAYAHKQADIQTSLVVSYAKKWIHILKRHEFYYSYASHYESNSRDIPQWKQKDM